MLEYLCVGDYHLHFPPGVQYPVIKEVKSQDHNVYIIGEEGEVWTADGKRVDIPFPVRDISVWYNIMVVVDDSGRVWKKRDGVGWEVIYPSGIVQCHVNNVFIYLVTRRGELYKRDNGQGLHYLYPSFTEVPLGGGRVALSVSSNYYGDVEVLYSPPITGIEYFRVQDGDDICHVQFYASAGEILINNESTTLPYKVKGIGGVNTLLLLSDKGEVWRKDGTRLDIPLARSIVSSLIITVKGEIWNEKGKRVVLQKPSKNECCIQ